MGTLGGLRRLTTSALHQVGFHPVTDGDIFQMCSTLDDQGLLRVGKGRVPRRRLITLSVTEDDVLFALKDVRVFRNLLNES